MAATESDSPPDARRHGGVTLRLRLTLLYGAVFIAAGGALLAVTYGLFKHNQNRGGTAITVSGVNCDASRRRRGPERLPIASRRRGTSSPRIQRRLRSNERVPPAKVLNRIRRLGQRQLVAQAHLYARRARVAVRAQQASDASSLLEWSVIAFVVVALLSIGVAWWLAGRALAPLRTMNARARVISAENLHERLGVDDRR